MKNSFGQSLSVTLFGESHGEKIGITVDGLAPGIKINDDFIKNCLDLRRPYGKISTSRHETDEYHIISGAYKGYTTGTPLTIFMDNKSTRCSDYSEIENTPRPGHADYTAECKYHGFQDKRGGGHFSGRITAPLVAAGALIRAALKERGIVIATHIKSLRSIEDRAMTQVDATTLETKLFPVLDPEAEAKMIAEIEAASAIGDSVGGVLETAIYGMPSGVGEPFFDSMESVLAHALFSVPGIKGVEFGAGFNISDMLGSEANDPFRIECGKVVTATNNNGGINGGITNGMPITFRCAVKPTPSIFKQQSTVSLSDMQNTDINICGRHDPAIVHRVRAVVDAICAIAVADMLTVRYGTDYLKG